MDNLRPFYKLTDDEVDDELKRHYEEARERFLIREKGKLAPMVSRVFETVSPKDAYLYNWHIGYMCEYAEAVRLGQIKRLMCNVVPRYLKSITWSVTWPAHTLGDDPTMSFLCASYAYGLSEEHSMFTRDVMRAAWYRAIFPRVQISDEQATKIYFKTTEGGSRRATSVGAGSTGKGARFLIIDDPHNTLEVHSDALRRGALNWYDLQFSTRLDDKKAGAIVIVMQRSHDNDLCGHLLEKDEEAWTVINIPAETKVAKLYSFNDFIYYRPAGELLHAEREGPAELAEMKKTLGTAGYAAQYQQDPQAAGGNIFKDWWWKRHTETPWMNLGIYFSIDTAFKTKKENAPTVCQVWLVTEVKFYLIHVTREWLAYPDMKRKILDLFNHFKPVGVLIEDKASGQSLIQDLESSTTMPIIKIPGDSDKVALAHAVSPTVEAGNVSLPEEADWIHDHLEEHSKFPSFVTQDQVVCTAQFLHYMQGHVAIYEGEYVRQRAQSAEEDEDE